MRRYLQKPTLLSRRALLRRIRWAPALLLPSPLLNRMCPLNLDLDGSTIASPFEYTRYVPDYPSASPLDEILKLVPPGFDAYPTERFAADLQDTLRQWSSLLSEKTWQVVPLAKYLSSKFQSNLGELPKETLQRATPELELASRRFNTATSAGRAEFPSALRDYFSAFSELETVEFELTHLKRLASQPLTLDTAIRYTFLGQRKDGRREERIGHCKLTWSRNGSEEFFVEKWDFLEENISRSKARFFEEITASMLGSCESHKTQLLHGTDYWRTVLDGASGIGVYGNNGVAAGDFDNDGFDDLYVCQPSGLPNRLYRNRGDGTFVDVTDKSGVAVLDATSCALFADLQNRGLQDLLVVCDSGPLLFLNRGNGTFEHQPDAFAFAKPPQGTFTHAALADYDRDGRLDVYFCLYTYYLGLDQYHYPSPYFDARNGPPNFLFHNEGNGKFVDRTEAAGLNAENDRFSFACAWGDASGNGWPDLYVANDFGRSNLYRNNGNGTFTAVSDEANVNDVGAGMSACWLDAENNGKQDIYVSNMWSAAGQRISELENFQTGGSAEIKSFYRRHARGNSLYKNLGGGKFKNVSSEAGVEMGRWAWSSDSWDFDHDGFADVYVTNGYISGSAPQELSSFFWRQVVGNSPATATPSTFYERGWNAINELIRSDHTWSGYERNTLYSNNGDGTFSEVSGVSGLDFLDDSRAFALADLNHDGRLEVVLKNRTAPQLRILQNVMPEIGASVCFRLQGTKSNRDAIGAAMTVQAGELRQTKYLQAGTGFLSQHTKELFFGIGKHETPMSATVRWPSGLTQSFQNIPVNHRVTMKEGHPNYSSTPFREPAHATNPQPVQPLPEVLPSSVTAWLLDPLPAANFALPDLSDKPFTLSSFSGNPLLLYLCEGATPPSTAQIESFQKRYAEFLSKGLQIIAVDVSTHPDHTQLREFSAKENPSFPILLGAQDFAGVYNIIYRYLFDRRRDLLLPCAFLLDERGRIVKLYQGVFDPSEVLTDAGTIPTSYESLAARALPFPGKLFNGRFQRNDFTYGVALFQHGYLDQAADSFRQVAAANPGNAEAFYNLGTLYLRKNEKEEAKKFLDQTVKLKPDYPEAWNNLGMIAAQQNDTERAIQNFRHSLEQRPNYVTAMLNLGNLFRRQGNISEASKLLNQAVELEPENAEANYSLGMFFVRQGDTARAESLLQKASALRPNYADAINNLGVLFIRDGRNAEAERQFKTCISVAPGFDQAYLNLAQLYMVEKENDKARETLESLLKLQPQHKLARQTLEMLN
jgi:Flp pilus assembly protein TadD/peroxiredoxin